MSSKVEKTNLVGNPELASYDVILVNSSAGKDSQCMLTHLVELASAAGVKDRMVVVHCDLGEAEWDGTKELAEEQAKHYGLRFEVVSNPKTLFQRIEERGKFPGRATRFCTSEFKTGQVNKLMTKIVRDFRAAGNKRPMRILNCLGLRAEESAERAKKPTYHVDAATNGKRTVHRWLPIHAWSVRQVWETIKTSGVRYHSVYDAGIPRLSCVFCPLASESALIRAAQLAPDKAQVVATLEARIGHSFQPKLSMMDIIEKAKTVKTKLVVLDWVA